MQGNYPYAGRGYSHQYPPYLHQGSMGYAAGYGMPWGPQYPWDYASMQQQRGASGSQVPSSTQVLDGKSTGGGPSVSMQQSQHQQQQSTDGMQQHQAQQTQQAQQQQQRHQAQQRQRQRVAMHLGTDGMPGSNVDDGGGTDSGSDSGHEPDIEAVINLLPGSKRPASMGGGPHPGLVPGPYPGWVPMGYNYWGGPVAGAHPSGWGPSMDAMYASMGGSGPAAGQYKAGSVQAPYGAYFPPYGPGYSGTGGYPMNMNMSSAGSVGGYGSVGQQGPTPLGQSTSPSEAGKSSGAPPTSVSRCAGMGCAWEGAWGARGRGCAGAGRHAKPRARHMLRALSHSQSAPLPKGVRRQSADMII